MVFAPVIAERKGEHLARVPGAERNGFVRARIDGIVVDLDSTPDLDKNKKHTIEAVVDRLRVRDDVAAAAGGKSSKPRWSSPTALPWSASWTTTMRTAGLLRPLRLSKCGYSISELEPRMFSFNNPAGACESATAWV